MKRLVLGRPFRSDSLGHTLLSKRIALPVFASDPLSSVAYGDPQRPDVLMGPLISAAHRETVASFVTVDYGASYVLLSILIVVTT